MDLRGVAVATASEEVGEFLLVDALMLDRHGTARFASQDLRLVSRKVRLRSLRIIVVDDRLVVVGKDRLSLASRFDSCLAVRIQTFVRI